MARRKDIPAEAIARAQAHASFDVTATPTRHLLRKMISQHDILAAAGLTGADIGLFHDVEEFHNTPTKTLKLVSSTTGHRAAPRPRSVRYDTDSTYDREKVLHRQIRRHRQVARLLDAGRDPLRPGSAHVLADPVVVAAMRHQGDPDAILDAMPVDQPVVTVRGFFQVNMGLRCVDGVPVGLHAELEPGRLETVRVRLSDEAHYAPPDHEMSRRVGILTIRRTSWPMEMRLGIVGRRMNEIVGLPGIPDGHVVRTCSTSGGSMVLRIEGDHDEVPIG